MNLPTISDIEVLAQRAFEEILEDLRAAAVGIVFHVVDFPDDGGDGARDALRYSRPLSWGQFTA